MTTNYTKFKVNLTPNQKSKIQSAYRNGEDCSLRIEPKNDNTDLMLTASQNKSADINLSKTQLQKSGGFLPLLAAALPAVLPFIARAAATRALGYAVNKIAQKVMGKGIKSKKPKKRTTKKIVGSAIFVLGKTRRN